MDKREFSVREILAGQAPNDAPVTVKGWVRTRRDSKAGISFVHLSDGSSFHPVRRGGERDGGALARQGPAVRNAGERDQRDRLGGRPRYVPDPAKAAHD